MTHPEIVDGIVPCCNVLRIDCATGLLEFNTSHYNFSGFAPFLAAGKSVSVSLEGFTAANEFDMAACCKSASNCTMLENKEDLAQQLLELALKFKLTSFTGDW